MSALEALHLLDNDAWSVHQVYSHLDPADTTDPSQEWFINGNHKADKLAERAHSLRPIEFQNNHRWLLAHEDRSRKRVKQQLDLLVAIAQDDFRTGSQVLEWDPEDLILSDLVQPRSTNDCELAAQVELDYVQTMPKQLSDGFTFSFRAQLCEFLFTADQQAAQARFVLGLELLAAFMLFGHGRIPIPREVGGVVVYEDSGDVVSGGLIRPTLAGAVGALQKAIKACFRSLDIMARWDRRNKTGVGVLMPAWALHIGWPDQYSNAVDGKLSEWFRSRPVRRSCDLARPF